MTASVFTPAPAESTDAARPGGRRYRVLLVATHPVQYASPVFRQMAAHPRLDVTVAYCSLQGAQAGHDPEFGRDVQWDVPLLDGYRWIQIPNRAVRPGLGRFFGIINPGLWRLIRKSRFDAVALYTGYRCASFWIAVLAAKVSGAAVLFGTDAHELRPRDARSWKTSLKAWLWPKLFRLADVVIVPSSGGVALMRSLGLPEERVTLTPYTVDNEWWSAQAARADRETTRAAWQIPPDAAVALFCAKLQPWKRPSDLLRAFARAAAPDAYLVFAGDGPLKSALEEEAGRLGISGRVRFLGFVNQTALPAVYCAADLLVLPSQYEPFAVVVNEAMLCGCPVAVSDHVGARYDLVRPGENGFVFRCGEIEELAAFLRDILPDRARMRALGARARERMRDWSPTQNIEAFVSAVTRAVNRRATEEQSRRREPRSSPQARAGSKVLIYSHFFAPSIGGVETVIESIARGLAGLHIPGGGRELDVTVVTETPAENSAHTSPSFRLVRRPSLLELWRLIGKADAVLVAGPGMVPMALAILRRRRLLVGHHGYQAICPNGLLFHHPTQSPCVGHFRAGRYWECLRCNAGNDGWRKSLALLLLTFPRRALCRMAAWNVPVSSHVAWRIELPRCHVAVNGIAGADSFGRAGMLTPERGSLSVAYVGRLVVEKGAHVLIEAARLLKSRGRKVHIDIIGDGPERPRLERMASEFGVNDEVAFCGFQRGRDLDEFLRKAPVTVIPSVWEEAAGLVAIEQMLQGKLIVASDIGGLAELVGETALKFPPGDAQALAERIELILDQPELIGRLGSLARERALKEYTLERTIESYRELLHA